MELTKQALMDKIIALESKIKVYKELLEEFNGNDSLEQESAAIMPLKSKFKPFVRQEEDNKQKEQDKDEQENKKWYHGNRKYKKEHYDFLRLYRNLTNDELLKVFNNKFKFKKPISYLTLKYLRAKMNKNPQFKGLKIGQSGKLWNRREWTKDRNFIVKIIKTHYFGSNEDKEKIAKEVNLEWAKIVKSISQWIRMKNIQPEEVGLLRFPTRTEKGKYFVNKLKI